MVGERVDGGVVIEREKKGGRVKVTVAYENGKRETYDLSDVDDNQSWTNWFNQGGK
jgi:hypothetical protein